MANKSVTITFNAIPQSVEQFCALPEMAKDTPFKTAALSLLALLAYEKNPNLAIDMLNVLRGPEPLSPYDKQFLKDRLTGKYYKVRSFFQGATPANNYQYTSLTITVSENPYSYPEDNRAVMWVQSSGADSPRQITLRKKPSTGEWFLREVQCLSDIRIPVAEDAWA